jgi:hypothetical protein
MVAIQNSRALSGLAPMAVILGLLSASYVRAQVPNPPPTPSFLPPASSLPAQPPPSLPPPVLSPVLADQPSSSQASSEGGVPPSTLPSHQGGLAPGIPGLYGPVPVVAQPTTTVYVPRSIADYAPPGLQPRPPQAGAAYPLYTPLDVPRPEISPEERSKFVTAGLFPGTYLIPGTPTSLKFYGFVRLDGIFDFNPIGSTDDFVTSSIPIPQGRGQNADLNPRYSRLGFMTYTPTPINDWTVQTKLEMDFFNGNTSGAFGSYPIRLRFAYLDWGYFRVGNDASVFMDYDVFPNVLDYEGPPGMVLMRQALFRITVPLGDQVHWAMAVEQPFSDITPSEGGKNIQDLPDFTTHIRYDAGLGHVQLSGVMRKITNQPSIGTDQNLFGWGLNLTGDFHPWAYLNGVNPASKANPNGLERSRFLGQYAAGFGINRYIQDVNGLGLDAAAGPGGMFRLIQAAGWFGAYEHWWTEKWSTTLVYGESRSFIPGSLALPGDTYKAAQYGGMNLVWVPLPSMMIGAEYLYGSRTNLNGEAGFAHRIQVAWQYNF